MICPNGIAVDAKLIELDRLQVVGDTSKVENNYQRSYIWRAEPTGVDPDSYEIIDLTTADAYVVTLHLFPKTLFPRSQRLLSQEQWPLYQMAP